MLHLCVHVYIYKRGGDSKGEEDGEKGGKCEAVTVSDFI